MYRVELLNRAASWVIGDQVAEFAENVPSNLDHVLVADGHTKMGKHRFCCVRLQIFVICYQLDDSIPHFGSNVIAGSRYELKYSIDIPLVLVTWEGNEHGFLPESSAD